MQFIKNCFWKVASKAAPVIMLALFLDIFWWLRR